MSAEADRRLKVIIRAELHFLHQNCSREWVFFVVVVTFAKALASPSGKDKQLSIYKKRVHSQGFSCFGIQIVSVSLHRLWALSSFSTKFFSFPLSPLLQSHSLFVSQVENQD